MSPSPFAKLMAGILPAKKNADADFWSPVQKPYPRLANIDVAGLAGREGIYALWHLGVRPQWLRVGATADLGAALQALAQEPWITAHGDNAGVFAAWAFPPPDQTRGMARYLSERLKPAMQSTTFAGDLAFDSSVDAVVCALPPGTLDAP